MPESHMTRRRSAAPAQDEPEETTPRARRRRSAEEGEPAEKPSRRARVAEKSEEEDKPTRRRSSGGTGGFASFSQKKRSNSNFADEFKPTADVDTLIKILDAEPFDTYNQHWVEEGNAAGKTRHSFVCRDDQEYFEDFECPLCEVGEPASTYSLFNILDLSNPRKPEVKVWRTSPAVTEKLERASRDKKTAPLNRGDLYFQVTMVKKKNKTEWDILPVKERDLEDDFDLEPLDADEIADFEEKKFTDRTAVTKVDSKEELQELADSLD